MKYLLKLSALALLLPPATPALAQPAGEASVQGTERQGAFSRGRAASEEVLQAATAREDVAIIAQSQQTSTVSNSSVNGTSRTGEVSIADNAFQNASGLTVVNINTGNNVAMNGSMSINIVITPPPSPQ